MGGAMHRILVMAHGHPDFNLGGGEIAAHNLYKAYLEQDGVEAAWYLGRADRGRGATGIISVRHKNEYLWEQAIHDWDRMKAAHQESLSTWFADLIRALKPTIIHSHHYAHLGLEYFRIIKKIDPDIRIYLTLHEYMAICRNNGQMVKTDGSRLCSQESLDDCHRCFPDKTVDDFWLRKHYFQSQFKMVDGFIAPSQFLRQRYVSWGIDPERIKVIENGQFDDSPPPPRPLPVGETRNRFAYFGQITPFKGLDVVLEALTLLTESERRKIVFEVHGANLEYQSQIYKDKINRLRLPLIEDGSLVWVGPYQAGEVKARMAMIDWVVVPSIWWENSPMIIQEAYACGRPLLCSDIGGMAEKVIDGKTGIHVRVGNNHDWANKIMLAAGYTQEWSFFADRIQKPPSYADCALMHLAWFDRSF